MVKKLFDVLAPRYVDRPGGYGFWAGFRYVMPRRWLLSNWLIVMLRPKDRIWTNQNTRADDQIVEDELTTHLQI